MVKAALAEAGGFDVLVNNAGITRDGLSFRMKQADWDDVIRVNLTSVFLISQIVSSSMISAKDKSCSIINMASIVGLHGQGGQVNYAASKGGIIAYTKALAKEVGSRGVRVNAIAPGFFSTKQNAALLWNDDGTPTDRTKKILAATPMGRFGEPKELEGALLFLVNERAAGFITGVVLPVDGGFNVYSGV